MCFSLERVEWIHKVGLKGQQYVLVRSTRLVLFLRSGFAGLVALLGVPVSRSGCSAIIPATSNIRLH
jgi:hypothetical protein